MVGSAARADLADLPRPTTPTGLRIALGVIVGLVVVFTTVGAPAIVEQQRAADAVGSTATPLLARAEELYVALADADAAASTSYLVAGAEPPELRDRYQAAIDLAGQRLAEAGMSGEITGAAGAAVVAIDQQLPRYTANVERARTNNRLGFPVGAASLRLASQQMREQILPAATDVYRAAADAVGRNQRTGASAGAVVVLGIGAGLLLVALVGTQVFLALRTRRIVNVWLLAATALTLVLGITVADGLVDQRDAVVASRERGSDPLLALSAARILALRSLNDQNLDLIERGTEPVYREDFADVTAAIVGDDGLLAAAAGGAIDGRAGDRIEQIAALHTRYLDVHDRVDGLLDDGSYAAAVALATTEQVQRSAALDRALAAELDETRASLDRHAAAAGGIGGRLVALLVLGGVAIIALSAVGIGRRLREYR